ncbi:MAG: hypothetical protein N3G20_01915 [Verrucomicrobiae bacterium]|nr:hypothetical protein [Verrucomicrobiae bacterium]
MNLPSSELRGAVVRKTHYGIEHRALSALVPRKPAYCEVNLLSMQEYEALRQPTDKLGKGSPKTTSLTPVLGNHP